MEATKILQKLAERLPLSKFLPYLAFDPETNTFVTETGVGFVLLCTPLSGADSLVAASLKSIFETQMPEGTSIQFMLLASKKIEPILDLYVLLRENVGDPMMVELAKKRREFLLKGVEGSICPNVVQKVRDYKLIISVLMPCKITPEAFIEGVSKIKKYKEFVQSSLRSTGIPSKDINADEFIKILSEMIAPTHEDDIDLLRWDPRIPLSEQLLFSDSVIEVHSNYLKIGNKFVRSLTVRQFPSEWDITKGINMIGDVFESAKQIDCNPFFISLNCEYPNQVKLLSKIKSKAMAVSYQAFGPMAKWITKLGLKKEEFDKFTYMLETGASPFYGYIHFCVFGDNFKELEHYTSQVINLYRSLGFTLQIDDLIGLPLFLQSLPLGYIKESQEYLYRRKTLTTENLSEIAPIQAEWKGFGAPAFLLVGRRGQIQHFNLFDNPAGGYSAVVVAMTGAGKSFFVNELIYSYLSLGAKIWVIDVGRSYEKLCHLFNGEFVVFGKDAKLNLNPFTFVQDINEEMSMLKGIIACMASKSPLDDLKMSYIEEAIKKAFFEKGNKTTVTDVANHLLNHEDVRARDIGTMLFPYTKDGAYAEYFEGEANISFRTNFTVLELEELKNKLDLRDVVLLALIYQIQNAIATDRRQMKILIIDEAWDLLTGGSVSDFIEGSYRRFRKYKGSAITITQSINDFYRIPAGVAIIENADFFFLLRQRAESIEALKKTQRLSLNEYYYDLLKSLKTVSDNYSEIFVYTPVGITVGRFVVDRFTQLLYSTKPDDYNRVKAYMNKGYNVVQAVEAVLAEEENRAIKSNIN